MRQNVTSIDIDKKSEIRAGGHAGKALVVDHGMSTEGTYVYLFLTIHDMVALRRVEVALEEIKKGLIK